MQNQLSLFDCIQEPNLDRLTLLIQQARAELRPGARLFRPKAGHQSANLSMFGIRGHLQSLCPQPLRSPYRPAYLNPKTEPSPC